MASSGLEDSPKSSTRFENPEQTVKDLRHWNLFKDSDNVQEGKLSPKETNTCWIRSD